MIRRYLLVAVSAVGAVCSLQATAHAKAKDEGVNAAQLSDQQQGENWLSYGRNFFEQRYSPLDQINQKTVKRLGLAWHLPLPEDRSLLSTPLVVDGVMYFTGSWSVTRAVNARTGELLWEYDPQTIKHAGDRLRVMWDSNRGPALWKGTLIIATIDGRLIGLEAKSGKKLWETQVTDPTRPIYITGHPVAFRDLVLVGDGGTEVSAARGVVKAYRVKDGSFAWQFHVVPGNPADGFENEAMEMAAKTWTGKWWEHGGGGNVWNGLTYDPEFNQVLIGTGNGSPWNPKVRSPEGGDNLFLCSIVALDADTGEYKWHYQTTPGEAWDYNSSMDITLANLEIDGKAVKALMHAPKNGFFYVIDRKDGRLISAEKFAKVTWASHIDLETGRPVENEGQRYEDGPSLVWPSALGAHNWHAMSYSPRTGLVYIPKQELPAQYDDTGIHPPTWQSPFLQVDPGVNIGSENSIPANIAQSSLLAWDPIKQQKAWEVQQPEFWNAGTMVTAGDLVFQGDITGQFSAYNAKDGTKLWSVDVGTGISAPPVTYSIDGKQYVSLLVGFGGIAVSTLGGEALQQFGWDYKAQKRQLLSFALDETRPIPDVGEPVYPKPIVPLDFQVDEKRAHAGSRTYVSRCVWCHGGGAVSGGYAPDLRASPIALSIEALKVVVIDGIKRENGMPGFDDLKEDDLINIQHYLRQKAALSQQPEKPSEGEAP